MPSLHKMRDDGGLSLPELALRACRIPGDGFGYFVNVHHFSPVLFRYQRRKIRRSGEALRHASNRTKIAPNAIPPRNITASFIYPSFAVADVSPSAPFRLMIAFA